MTTALAEKNILVRSENGDWYAIPPSMEDEFIAIKERTIDSEVGSDEWNEANDELNATFGIYLKD